MLSGDHMAKFWKQFHLFLQYLLFSFKKNLLGLSKIREQIGGGGGEADTEGRDRDRGTERCSATETKSWCP